MARGTLSRDRILRAAAAVADAGGLGAVSMRSVARELGVEAMSLYHHVAGKEDLLNLLADWVFGQIRPPDRDRPWRPAMTDRARSQRAVLRAHPWGLGFLESRRRPGEASIAHHDAVLGCLRGSGFSTALAAHAFSVLDAYVFGFVLTETSLPFEPGGAMEMAGELALDPERFPHLAELVHELTATADYDYGDEFEVGLDLILDALAARL